MNDSEFQLPDLVDISPDAVLAAEAILDPTLTPPSDARRDVDKKTRDEFFRWSENLVIEAASRKRTPKGLTEFFVMAKIRPGDREDNKNVGKNVYSRYRINFKVLKGEEENTGHQWMNRIALAAITSLLKATEFLPNDASKTGISMALLTQLFPADVEPHDSGLVGRTAIGSLVDRPNKAENAKYDRQTEVELWSPPEE